eukprot:g4263.t1
MTAPRVAFLGLGSMGWQICRRIVQSGAASRVSMFDPTPDLGRHRLDELAAEPEGLDGLAAPVAVADSAVAAVAGADVLVTCLPRSEVVAKVHEEIRGQLAAPALEEEGGGCWGLDKLWIDTTSGDPITTETLATSLRELGSDAENRCSVALLDVGVSGGPAGAARGALSAMVGGEEAAFERSRPILDSFASNVVHLGPPGAGHAVKAINNTLMASNIVTAAEGMLALVRRGVDPDKALSVINTSSGRSWATIQRFPDHVLPGTFDYGFSLGLLAKDVECGLRLINDSERQGGIGRDKVLARVAEVVGTARDKLGHDVDHLDVVRMLEEDAGIAVRFKKD